MRAQPRRSSKRSERPPLHGGAWRKGAGWAAPPSKQWPLLLSTRNRRQSGSWRGRSSALTQLLQRPPAPGVGDVGGGEPSAAGGGDGVGHVVEGVDAVGVGV